MRRGRQGRVEVEVEAEGQDRNHDQDHDQDQDEQHQRQHRHQQHPQQQLQLPWDFMVSVSAASASCRDFFCGGVGGGSGSGCSWWWCSKKNSNDNNRRTNRRSRRRRNVRTCTLPSSLLHCLWSSSLNNNNNNNNSTYNHHFSYSSSNSNNNKIWIVRMLFIGCLCAVAAGLGTGVYYLRYNAEQRLAISRFEGLADRAIDSAQLATDRKVLGSITMARLYSTTFKDNTEWPYVHLDNFFEVSSDLLETSTGRGFIFAPIVQPGKELEEFEEWIRPKLQTDDDDGNETVATAGVSSFGYGVYSWDYSLNNTDKRYHDTTGETSWGSPNRILTPITQVISVNDDFSTTSSYLLNYHSIESRGSAMDESIECSCGSLSDISSPFGVDDPGSVVNIPIIPANANTTNNPSTNVAGFLISPILWQSVLDGAFSSKVSGIDVVLTTSGVGRNNNGTKKHTFRIVDGISQYLGPDDYHDSTYDEYQRMTMLTEGRAFQNLSPSSPTYYMHIYPSDEYFNVSTLSNPLYETFGTVLIIFLTSLLFFVYDALVMKENRKNHEILEGRRRFMRFVSHETVRILPALRLGYSITFVLYNRLFSSCFPSSRSYFRCYITENTTEHCLYGIDATSRRTRILVQPWNRTRPINFKNRTDICHNDQP